MEPFKKTDWYGYAGCISWPDGTEPHIGYIEVSDWPDGSEGTVDLIADSQGIHVQGMDYFAYLSTTLTKEAALLITNNIPKLTSCAYLRKLGFTFSGPNVTELNFDIYGDPKDGRLRRYLRRFAEELGKTEIDQLVEQTINRIRLEEKADKAHTQRGNEYCGSRVRGDGGTEPGIG